MYRNHTVAVVVPAYNEAEFVGRVIDTMPAVVDRIYVVDDGSTDDTWTVMQTHATRANAENRHNGTVESRRVVTIKHRENRGVGGAIKTGYRRALGDEMDVTVVMGGDGQMETEILTRLLDPIVEGRADYVKGNRLMGQSGHGTMPRFRYVGNTVLSVLTKIASGYWENGDPQSGYTAISRDALESARIEELYEDYGYCNDLLVRLNLARQRVMDVPRPITYGDEQSDIVYSKYVPRVSLLLLRGFLRRLLRRYVLDEPHPVVLLYAGGVGGVAAGSVEAVAALRGGRPSEVRRSLLTGGLGGLLVLAAVLVDRGLNADISLRDSAATATEDERERERREAVQK